MGAKAMSKNPSHAPGSNGAPPSRGRVARPAVKAAYSLAVLPVNMPPLAPS
jgi:hypothetical protein